MICELCSFECDMGKYITQWISCDPLGEHLIHWACAVFSHITRKMNNVCIFSHDQVTHDISAMHTVQFNLQLECGMGWYRYTSHSENHCTECENGSFWKCLYGSYDVDVKYFVTRLSDGGCSTRVLLDLWWHRPCVVQTASHAVFLTK